MLPCDKRETKIVCLNYCVQRETNSHYRKAIYIYIYNVTSLGFTNIQHVLIVNILFSLHYVCTSTHIQYLCVQFFHWLDVQIICYPQGLLSL
jgi:hypothetical protein